MGNIRVNPFERYRHYNSNSRNIYIIEIEEISIIRCLFFIEMILYKKNQPTISFGLIFGDAMCIHFSIKIKL